MQLSSALEAVKLTIKETSERCSRSAEHIQLVGASKGVLPEKLREAFEVGLHCFGENRAQELKAKVHELPGNCEWHFIGGLQTNKVKDVVPWVTLIHSVDRIELATEIDKRAGLLGKTQKVLVEINVGGETNKHGVAPEKMLDLILFINHCKNLEVIGLMTVAPFFEDLEKVRPFFRKLRELKNDLEQRTGLVLPELSMGMSHDYTVAIEEGSTIVRIGTAIFGTRTHPM
ncbi:MAG: YggS family pyridoxal phosphate-dependent enzyme [Verrucomicrobiota bacterium]